jgi:hypothetical protein
MMGNSVLSQLTVTCTAAEAQIQKGLRGRGFIPTDELTERITEALTYDLGLEGYV